MIRSISLGLLLLGIWLLWSGIYEPLIIGFGVVSCILVVLLCRRMRIVDAEGQPFELFFRFMLYLPWLLWEIVKANIDVARRIVSPKMPISPRIVEIVPHQKTDLGRVILANSITLTPGTISIEAQEEKIVIHSLARGLSKPEQDEMDGRVRAVEGRSG